MSPRAKRKRGSVGGPDARSTAREVDQHEIFTSWARDRGVEIDGVEAQRILFIPESAMFKPDPNLVQKEHLTTASPQAQLAVSAMLAFGRANSSLKVWQTVWPTVDEFKQGMPMYWPPELHGYLPPPVQQPLVRQLSDYDKDWTAAQALCRRRGFEEEEFKYYWAIVNSRSFHWKPPQKKIGVMVMCPFIDYLNHGPTGSSCKVALNAKGYEVTADRDYGELLVFSHSS
jgi:hypothetical protein